MMILLVWLLMAGVAGAAVNEQGSAGDTNDFITIHSSPTGCYASFGSPPRQVEVECQEPQGLPVPVCLGKMEAAMRAMEPYTIELSHDGTARFVLRDVIGLQPAKDLWDEAKQCWRKP